MEERTHDREEDGKAKGDENQRRIMNWDKKRGKKREVNQSTEEQGSRSAFI